MTPISRRRTFWPLGHCATPVTARKTPSLYAERAFRLADTTIDTERYFILGSYYQMKPDIEKAVAAYEALLRLNPRQYWALGNLGRLYRAMGRHTTASELRARQIALRPGQFWGQYRMAEALLLKGDLDGAKRYAAKRRQLGVANGFG